MIRETNRKLFGSDLIDASGEVWGLDDEGELRGVFKPCGVPGVRDQPILNPVACLSLGSSGTQVAISITLGSIPRPW